jgi:hypothetical protein
LPPAVSTELAISKSSKGATGGNRITKQINLGGNFTLVNTSLTVNRMGYGAMQLAGPQVWGPPHDSDEAVRVLRKAVECWCESH